MGVGEKRDCTGPGAPRRLTHPTSLPQPRIFGFDLKQFTNCRHALMLWPLIPLSFAAHMYERGALTNAMVVNVALQVVYCFKFFVWEAGYMASMDIAHDRAGVRKGEVVGGACGPHSLVGRHTPHHPATRSTTSAGAARHLCRPCISCIRSG